MKSNPSSQPSANSVFNDTQVEDWRAFFPALDQQVNGRPLIYLDNAATSLRPIQVIGAVSDYYSTINANVHRANHFLGHQSTRIYEAARQRVADFIGASSSGEIVFTKGTSESINFVAAALSEHVLQPGDTVILTESEHHSNMVPWIHLKQRLGIRLEYIPVEPSGEADIAVFERILEQSPNVRLVSIAHASNLTGAVHPLHEMTRMAKRFGALVMIDGAQGVVHHRVDVEEIGCDFYAFSAHKMYGPMGVGVLYIKEALHEMVGPYQFGGGMIDAVHFDRVSYAAAPYKYEAGTPNVAGAAGLLAAIDFMTKTLDFEAAVTQEQMLLGHLEEGLSGIRGVSMLGQGDHPKDPIVSFYVPGVHHYDIATMLDGFGVAVRAGHHCVQPLLRKWGLEGTIRASLSFYNTKGEIDAFLTALERVLAMLG